MFEIAVASNKCKHQHLVVMNMPFAGGYAAKPAAGWEILELARLAARANFTVSSHDDMKIAYLQVYIFS